MTVADADDATTANLQTGTDELNPAERAEHGDHACASTKRRARAAAHERVRASVGPGPARACVRSND